MKHGLIPIDEVGLDKLHKFKSDKQAYWYQVVVENDKGQKVETKVGIFLTDIVVILKKDFSKN